MWINIVGESHSLGYRIGLNLLSGLDANFPASITESGSPEAYRDDALRVSGLRRNQYSSWETTTGEGNFYTNSAERGYFEGHIDYCENNSLHIAALGFGWCWDMTWINGPTANADPVFGCHWYGTSVDGPDGNLEWGLDSDDYSETANQVCMDTYLSAVQQYIDHCTSEAYTTKVFYTTGPVDEYLGEAGYQRHVKHEYIRQHVLADSSRILFDYADILAWSNAGEENIQTWNGHNYQMIHGDNMLDLDEGYEEDGDHIGEKGTVRLAKAVWVMLAYIAGWNGPQGTRALHPRYKTRVIS